MFAGVGRKLNERELFFLVEEVDTFGGALFFFWVFLHLFQLLLPLLPLFWGVKPASPNAGFPENLNFTTSPEVRSCGTNHAWEMAISVIKVDGVRSFCECPKKRGKGVTHGNFIFFLGWKLNLLEQK